MNRNELKPARHRAKLTQQELANITGVSRKVISDIERGVGNPSMNTWDHIVGVISGKLEVNGNG